MILQIRLAAVCLAMLTLASSSLGAYEFYMRVKTSHGDLLNPTSKRGVDKRLIPLKSVKFGGQQAGVNAPGQMRSQLMRQAILAERTSDWASLRLGQLSTNGEHLPQVEFLMCKMTKGKMDVYYRVVLTDAELTSKLGQSPKGSKTHPESLSFTFQKIDRFPTPGKHGTSPSWQVD